MDDRETSPSDLPAVRGQTAEELTTELWRCFRNGRAYQTMRGLTRLFPLCVRFYEGDQWAPPTKHTRNLPRPVVNLTKMICRSKKSVILSTPVRIVYKSYDDQADVERFNRFSDYIQKELGQEALDKKGIDCAVKKGSYFYHYYWDADAGGLNGRVDGALRGEMIDPLNIFFADPTETDEQKQAWILIASRERVDRVKRICDPDVDTDLIRADEADDPYHTNEQDGSELVTVLTRYFRRDGEVYIEKAVRNTVVNKPFPLTPNVDLARAALQWEDAAEKSDGVPAYGTAGDGRSNRRSHEKRSAARRRGRAYLYPIVVGNYEFREGCIYGLGEVEGIIPNQRAVNFNIAMMLLSAQENGWGKYVVSKDALKGQVITNEPGQVLTDYTPGGNGIRRLSDHTLPTAPMQIVNSLTQLTRVVTGASEVMTGESLGASMSGAAIAQLQSQALVPVEELKNTFFGVKKKQGLVLAQFYKLFYAGQDFIRTEKDAESGKELTYYEVFDSADYATTEFEVVVETVGGTKASAAGDITALDVALQKGAISVRTYFELYPRDALSNRTEILSFLEREEANRVAVLQEQLQVLQAQLAEREATVAAQAKTVERVESVIRENQTLRQTLAELYSEAVQKIRYANRQLHAAGDRLHETVRDASTLAQVVAQAAEVGGDPGSDALSGDDKGVL